jgi:hypothetical protein
MWLLYRIVKLTRSWHITPLKLRLEIGHSQSSIPNVKTLIFEKSDMLKVIFLFELQIFLGINSNGICAGVRGIFCAGETSHTLH